MRIAVSGSTGLIGKALAAHLRSDGHEVVRLVRSESRASAPDTCWWQPETGVRQPEKLHGIQAVVHLAGRGIAEHRWTEHEKARLRSSRVDATERLCHDLRQLPQPPETFLCASAVGIYGDCGDQPVSENHAAGDDFLARLAVDWEVAASALAEARVRVIHARFGVVLSPDGGALAKMLPLFRIGLGSNLGSGRQYWSWIVLDDAVRAVEFLLTTEAGHGAFNVVAPHPVTNAEFTRTLASELRRSRFLPVPRFALRTLLGEMADAALLASCRAVPDRLTSLGFDFKAPTLAEALAQLKLNRD